MPIRYTFLFFMALLGNFSGKAQTANALFVEVSGHVRGIENDKRNTFPLQGANVEFISLPDSIPSGGTMVNEKGDFHSAYVNGQFRERFFVRISYVGMETFTKECSGKKVIDAYGIPSLAVSLDTVFLKTRPITMEETIIVGELKKMYMAGDTTVFNTDAFKMPSGSILLELVRRLPGLNYDALTGLTYQGKSIEEIRLNGESFFKHDMSIALANIPVNRLERVQIYETGKEENNLIEEKKTVMDMKTKDPVNHLWLASLTMGATDKEHRSLVDSEGSSFNKGSGQLALSGESSNLPLSYSGSFGATTFLLSDASSLQTESVKRKVKASGSRSLKQIDLDGLIDYKYQKDIDQRTDFSETYLSPYSQFDLTEQNQAVRKRSISGQVGLSGGSFTNTRWNMNVNLDMQHGHSETNNQTGMYNKNPYEGTNSPLHAFPNPGEGLINQTESHTLERSEQQQLDWSGDFNRTFDNGRKTFSGRANFQYNHSQNKQLNQFRTRYFLLDDSTEVWSRYIDTPVITQTLNLLADYTQFFGKHSWGISYTFDYTHTQDKSNYYNTNKISDTPLWETVANALTPIDSLSQRGTGYTIVHTLAAKSDFQWSNWELHTGISLLPTYQHVEAERENGFRQDTSYTKVTFRPEVELAYHTNQEEWQLSYFGQSLLPSASQLLSLTDCSNPLYIREGNPHLKQAYYHSVELQYRKRGKRIRLNWNGTENSISEITEYNPTTGVRRTRPENIQGNWQLRVNVNWKILFKNFSLNLEGDHGFYHLPQFVQDIESNVTTAQKSVTRKHESEWKLIGKYEHKSIETSLVAQFNYNHWKNNLQDLKSVTRDYTLKGYIAYSSPFHLVCYSRYTFATHNGYYLTESNHNEHIWDLGISYKFLKEKTAVVRFEFYDLLHQRSSVLRHSISNNWSETVHAGINHFAMFTFSYRFNLFQ